LAGFILFLGVLAIPFRNTGIIRFISGGNISLCLIFFLLVLALIMGIIPQRKPDEIEGTGILGLLGIFSVTSSWPFVFLYIALLCSLAMTVAKSFLNSKRLVFLLNHLGLFLVLIAAGLGAPDREDHVMRVVEGEVEWRVHGDKMGDLIALPIAIRLDDFSMEEYPAHLAVIKRNTGVVLPEGKPEFFFLDNPGSQKGILDLEIDVLEFLSKAVPVGDGIFARAIMKASTQAAKIHVKNKKSGFESEAWIAAGNSFVMPQPFELDEDRLLVMSRPDPKLFVSKVKVFTQEGVEKEGEVMVNKPIRAGDWLIYQYSYDNAAGNLSMWSSFLLVKDPWLFVAYVGFIILALGALGLVIMGKKRG
jgi:hypothetical protein